jgi:hypothetical protein
VRFAGDDVFILVKVVVVCVGSSSRERRNCGSPIARDVTRLSRERE